MKTLKIILLSVLFINFISCDKDQANEEKETSFFQIKINNIEEIVDENKIIIQYKLTDDQNIGVKGKTDTDFNIYEKVVGDDEDLSDPTEARRYIVPTPTSYAYASMVIMDLSGSVINDIDVIKSSSKDYINNLFNNLNSGNLEVGVYFFDGRTELQEVISFSNSKLDVIQAIESMTQDLQQQEQTALYHGVSQSCDLMNAKMQSFISNPELTIYSSSIVVFSDGQNSNYINIDRNMMNTKIQQTHNLTSFYCIAAGNDIDTEVINDIGLDDVFTITDYSELNIGLNKVLDLIIREANSNYELEFCTAKKGIEVQFRIEVKDFQTVQSGQSYFDSTGFSTDYSCIINN